MQSKLHNSVEAVRKIGITAKIYSKRTRKVWSKQTGNQAMFSRVRGLASLSAATGTISASNLVKEKFLRNTTILNAFSTFLSFQISKFS